MSGERLTVEQCRGAISNALEAHDVEAAVAFLDYMARRWPVEAGEVLETINVAMRIRAERDGSGPLGGA